MSDANSKLARCADALQPFSDADIPAMVSTFTEALRQRSHKDQIVNYRPTWEFKILILGDAGVGKTAWLHHYLTAKCQREYVPGVGIILPITINTNYGMVTFQCWDTTGRHPITDGFYADAMGCILMFDVTNTESYKNIGTWHKAIKQKALVPTILYGTKVDKPDRKIYDVTYHRDHKLQYYECRDSVFKYLARVLTGYHDIKFC